MMLHMLGSASFKICHEVCLPEVTSMSSFDMKRTAGSPLRLGSRSGQESDHRNQTCLRPDSRDLGELEQTTRFLEYSHQTASGEDGIIFERPADSSFSRMDGDESLPVPDADIEPKTFPAEDMTSTGEPPPLPSTNEDEPPPLPTSIRTMMSHRLSQTDPAVAAEVSTRG